MKFSITTLASITGLLLAQSALGLAIPQDESLTCTDCVDGSDEPEAPNTHPIQNQTQPAAPKPGPTCDDCSNKTPPTVPDEDCEETTLYHIHPVRNESMCLSVQIDYDNVVKESKLLHLEPCDMAPLGRFWNLQSIKKADDGSLTGPTLLRLDDTTWCMDTRSTSLENGAIPHLYNCSEPTAPWGQQDWYIGENSQLQIHDAASGKKTCLDIEHGETDGRSVQMWECDLKGENPNQGWIIKESNAPTSKKLMYPHVHRD